MRQSLVDVCFLDYYRSLKYLKEIMRSYILLPTILLFLACSASNEKSEEANSKAEETPNNTGNTDFSGTLNLVIDDETFEYKAMTKSGSRLSFQDKGISVYVENTDGEGTIATVTILSPDIYNSNSHTYTKGPVTREEGMSQEDYDIERAERKKTNMRLKFRRIDNMEGENYIELDRGEVSLEYDDENADFILSFEGEDRPSGSNKKEDEKTIKFSGSLKLNGAYLMDSRD